MNNKLKKPDNNDWLDCTKLIYISAPHFYTYSMLKKDPEIYEFFKIFYNAKSNMFSKDNMTIEEENGRIRGIVMSYPAAKMKIFQKNMFNCIGKIIKLYGIFNIIKMFSRMKLNKYLPALNNDEYYISNLAVFKEYRGKGIGVELLKHAEKTALKKGLKKLALYLELDNTHAKRIYEKFGFEKDAKSKFPHKYHKYNIFGVYKMVKKIR